MNVNKKIWSMEQFINAQIDSFPLVRHIYHLSLKKQLYIIKQKNEIKHCTLKKKEKNHCILNGKINSTVNF